ncbi:MULTISPECIES: hypothetical protein [unclassified Pseudomonas]|uniref:LPD3 domain-containing protein n=1 Tax=unclassified Pseudomonas TaxID=196821 RepID=UPI000A1E1F5C|nr:MULTISPECIES: hypothetical protein [unclassified Pseudomonas]
MTDLSQAGVLPAIERARLSAELLQIRGQLVGNSLSPIERARASARALVIRDLLGAPKAAPDEGQVAFEAARNYYQEHLKGRVIQSVIGPVQINGTGWKKAKLGMKSDALKAKLIEYVKEILETGTAGQRQAPHKVRTDDFVAFHFIQKQVQVNELLVTAGVTVAEDSKGNLFYNVSHEGRDAWKAKENGATDYAGVGPRSDDADNGTLDSTQREQDWRTVGDTVADDDLNITILEVVVVDRQEPAANEVREQRAKADDTGRAPAGGVIGMNGEFYKGGTILPTTTLPKGASGSTAGGTGRSLVEPGVYEEPPVPGATSLYAQIKEFVKPGADGLEPDATRAVAIVHYLGENGADQLLAYCKAYNAGKRWILPGETIAPVSSEPAPAVKAPEIIEYKTKRDKILRGIIRTDLTLAEAKAIDPYTWRMNGGYFIREKHLQGDTSAIQAAPAPVVLTPEQEAEKQERDRREALERQQKAVAAQAEKLRQAGAKAIASGSEGMTADRKTNTARRAGMAASAFARAANDEAEGQTLTRIADAIEAGAAGALSGLTSRTQLQELKRALSRAKSDSEAGLSYSDKLARQGQPVGEEVIHLVRMPPRMVWATRYRDAARELAKKAPTGNSKLIAALSKMGDRVERWSLEKEADIAITRKAYQVLKTVKENWYLEDPMEVLARAERLRRMGISTDAQLQDACRALLTHLAAKQEESAVTKAERAIIGQKVGIDFFPTPAAVAHRMAKLARISKGDRVLEPSAGNGNLADAAAAAGGEVDVIEISSQLRDILTAKGYAVVDHDFMGFTPEQPYQAILMNPPFSKRQDAEHIMRAFGMLAAGGTLVAIAGEGVFFGSDKAAQHFRDWLDQHGAEVEKLEGGTFQDNALLAQTSANARLIVLRK